MANPASLIPKEPSYKPEFCQLLIDLLSIGKTKASFYLEADNISNTTARCWVKNYPEFARAMQIAEHAYEIFWEDVLESTTDPVRIQVAKHKLRNNKYSTRVSSHTKGGGYKPMSKLSKELEVEFDDPDVLDRKIETHAKKLAYDATKKQFDTLAKRN